MKQYYSTLRATADRGDYLKQVGHTYRGHAIPEHEYKDMLGQVQEILGLSSDDVVLDLCCGNGLITKELANQCREVVGVDVSEYLLNIAQEDHGAENLTYRLLDVASDDVDWDEVFEGRRFTKVLMFAALQHFPSRALESILKKCLSVSAEPSSVLLGFVPDRAKKWQYYNTPRRKLTYLGRVLRGDDPIATWWSKAYLEGVCRSLGLSCRFSELPTSLHSSLYRFHVQIQ